MSSPGRHGPRAPRRLGSSTRAIRAASRLPRVDQTPTSVPIYQSVTFSTADTDELADVTMGTRPGYSYSRLGNPTVTAVADAFAELHDAEAGAAFATGMAAIHAVFLSQLKAGDRLVMGNVGYGQTRVQAQNTFAKLGVRVDLVDTTDSDAVERALGQGPVRLLHVETIANPTCVVSDIRALAELAHRHGALMSVDNTFASPLNCQPLAVGADLVLESATKYLGGHSDVMAGVVAGPLALIRPIRQVEVDTGATLAPLAAFLVLRGISTVAVRFDRQQATAAALAGWLERQRGVQRVTSPALPSHPQAEIVARQLAGGGAMFSFDLEGGRPAGRAFIDALTIPERTASLGSVHTMVVHPPTTSHRAFDEQALADAGIRPGLLRVSIGLEDEPDLRDDFGQALDAANAAAGRSDTTPAAEALTAATR